MSISKERANQLMNMIKHTSYVQAGTDLTTTVCVVEVENGFRTVGSSHCANPLIFDRELGREYALENALEQLDQHVGMLEKQRLYEEKKNQNLQELKEAIAEPKIAILMDTMMNNPNEFFKEQLQKAFDMIEQGDAQVKGHSVETQGDKVSFELRIELTR